MPTPVPAVAAPSADQSTVSPDATIAIAVPSDAVASAPAFTPTPAPIVMVGISGRVQADDGTPLGEALVRADGSEAMTDPDGFFDLPEVILPPSGRVNVSFKKEGFATAQEALAAVPGERYVLDARLKPVDTTQEVDAQQDAMIMVIDDQGREKAMLELSAGSLIDASGNPVSGPATVEMTHGDPTQEIDIFPGEFEAAEGGSETPTMDLESFAFGEVSFMDDSGTELNQLDPQKPAILTLRLPDAFQTGGVRGGELKPGDTIPWWSYDETNGVWVQEDAEPTTPGMDDATVIADESGALFSQAGIVHASWWNSDKPISQSACLSVTVKTPQGSLVQGVRARAVGITYFGGSYAHSGADGRANFKVKRSDEITEMVRVSSAEAIGARVFPTLRWS